MAKKTKATTEDLVQVYRISIGWKIFYALATPAAAILFGLMVMPLMYVHPYYKNVAASTLFLA